MYLKIKITKRDNNALRYNQLPQFILGEVKP